MRRENPEKLIIVGGPPCQPFSKAGYWVTNEKRNSSEDPRNMIKPYFKIISELQPDEYELCGDFKEQWRQVGNAVPSDMAYIIASAIKEAYFNGR